MTAAVADITRIARIDLVEDEISLAELINRIRALTGPLKLNEAKKLLSGVVLTDADFRAFLDFQDKRYHREIIARGPHAELVMIGWRAKQGTPVHDHGSTVGGMRVLRGTLTEFRFRRISKKYALRVWTAKLEPGQFRGENAGVIHKVANCSKRKAVSLHLYSPPLSLYNTYEELLGCDAKGQLLARV